jgi:Na+-driven multidrug efflux pump
MGICFGLQSAGRLTAAGIWTAIVLGHASRCLLTVWRFEQGKWRSIKVD